ncbi:MAG: hypothetical protein H7210_06070 [Pyrinomonadaceae bacterium]|nr:hypothetical protein [Phycisphaerales bacterium]
MNLPGLKRLYTTTAVVAVASIALGQGAGTLPGTGDESRKAFDQLYAQQIRAAKATPSYEDDLALGRDLLKAADDLKNQPELLATFCAEAFALTQTHTEAHDTAAN